MGVVRLTWMAILATLASCSLLANLDGLEGPTASALDGASTTDARASDGNTSEPSDAGVVTSAYANAVLADAPLAYWRLGEPAGATSIKDETGNVSGSVITGAVTFGAPGALAGDSNTCASFVDDSWISLGDHFGFDYTSVFSLEAWVLPTQIDVWRPIVGRADYVNLTGGYMLMTHATNASALTLFVIDAEGDWSNYDAPLSAGAWAHIVMTYDGKNVVFYVNGAAAGTTQPEAFAASGNPFTIAGPDDGHHGGSSYNGLIDEVAVYGNALTADRVSAHYAAGIAH